MCVVFKLFLNASINLAFKPQELQ